MLPLKRILLTACASVSLAAVVSPGADTTPPKPTLQDIISSPKYLNETMGIKVLLVTNAKTGEVSPDLQKAIKQAGLGEGRQFYPLPKDAKQPVAKSQGAPTYPGDLRKDGVSGRARFLIFIGADGAVRAIYCHESSHPAFAVAGAAAIARWRFTPAMIEKTPVPVLAEQMMEFSTD